MGTRCTSRRYTQPAMTRTDLMIWNWEGACGESDGGKDHPSTMLRAVCCFKLLRNASSYRGAVHLPSSLPRVWLPAAIRCDPTRLERLGPTVWLWMTAPSPCRPLRRPRQIHVSRHNAVTARRLGQPALWIKISRAHSIKTHKS